jgi:hypothetical protein
MVFAPSMLHALARCPWWPGYHKLKPVLPADGEAKVVGEPEEMGSRTRRWSTCLYTPQLHLAEAVSAIAQTRLGHVEALRRE